MGKHSISKSKLRKKLSIKSSLSFQERARERFQGSN